MGFILQGVRGYIWGLVDRVYMGFRGYKGSFEGLFKYLHFFWCFGFYGVVRVPFGVLGFWV